MHIAGKAHPAHYLSRRSIQELRSMVDVHTTEESMVHRMRFGKGQSTDENIQKIFKRGVSEGSTG